VDAPAWAGLGVAVSVITLIYLIIMLVINALRKNAVTSLAYMELSWFGSLWILWLAAFADLAANAQICFDGGNNFCELIHTAEAFSFLAFFFLFAYWVTLFTLCLIAHRKGNSGVWYTSAGEPDFGTANGPGAAAYDGSHVGAPGHAMQKSTQYPPSQV